jgi:prolyl-tRNA synthetase
VALRARGEKSALPLDGLAAAIPGILEAEQAELLRQATELRDRLTGSAKTIPEAIERASAGAARVPWAALGTDGERRLLEQGISVRCLIGDPDEPEAIVARAY